jgi:glycosidase
MIAYADSGYDFTTSAAVATAASDVTFTGTDNTHGTLTVSRSVALACTTPSAVLRVTTDGTAPTRTNGSTYSSALKIDTDTTVRAFAYCDGLTDSAETSRVLSFSVPLSNHVADWRDESIYFMMTDRFNDGDSLNNSQMSSSFDGGDYDAGDGKKYQGGDFAGVTEKLDYLHNLGISAIWITSPVKQAWNNAGYTSYHGYWAQDFMSVDPHLGTMEDFRVMVYEAHSRGIKVIMDVVVNHAGSLFYYDIDGDGTADSGEWEPSYLEAGYNKAYLTWLEGSDWADAANRKKPMPVEFQNPAWWSLCGGNATSGTGTNEVLYGDFAGLRDINTANADVRAKFKEIFKWWIVNTDIDGIRIDTVKHVETSFWADFCAEMRTWAKSSEGGNKNFYMLAEVYDGSAAGLGTFTVNNMLDSVLGFHMADEVFDWNSGDNVTVFKDAGTWSTRPKTSAIESALSSITSIAALNADSIHTNGDGLTARQKIGYFIDNHDLNRFLNGTSDTANAAASSGEVKNLQAALSWLLTWEGLPVIYYGTEQNYKQSLALTNHGEMGDGAGNCEKGNRPRLWMVANSNNGSAAFDESNATFKLIQGLLSLRTTYPELSRGEVSIKWTDSGDGVTNDDGILAFVRKGDTATVDDDVLVVINTHPSQASAASAGSGNDMGTDWSVGTVLKTVAIPGFDSSQPTVNNGASDVIEVTTFAQTGKTSAVYFKVPAASVRIFVKK